jgi:hypothetical protein
MGLPHSSWIMLKASFSIPLNCNYADKGFSTLILNWVLKENIQDNDKRNLGFTKKKKKS